MLQTNEKYKTREEINRNAKMMAVRGIVASIPGATAQWMTSYANGNLVARELMEYTERFGRGLEQIYGIVDNLILAGWTEEPKCME